MPRLSLHNAYYPTLFVVLLSGCPAAVPDAGEPLAAPDAAVVEVVDSGLVVVDAGPPGPQELAVIITADGGVDDEVTRCASCRFGFL